MALTPASGTKARKVRRIYCVIAIISAFVYPVSASYAMLREVGAVIVGYTAIINVFLPEFWFHPFGPVLKNLPLVVAILIVSAVERE